MRMLKLYGKSIACPLSLIFQSVLNDGVFPDDWKKSNIVPCHEKDSKSLIKNYRPISLLPIFSKVFEVLIYNSLYNYFIQKKHFTERQSGFMPGDPCVAQLLSITHEIYKSFDYNPSLDVRGVFLDISKAFDKVWHDGLILKLQTYGIDGKLLKLLMSYLKDRQQRVLLNGHTSSFSRCSARICFGTIIVSNIYE